MIPITRAEKDSITKTFGDVYITGVNKEHPARAKGYYIEANKQVLRELSKTNVKARKELIEMLEYDLRKLHGAEEIKTVQDEIAEIKKLGI